MFSFIHGFAPKSITPAPDIEAYFSFVITMFLAFGITFEIPIVVIVLVRMGIVTIDKLKEARPYVIVGAFVVAAVVTPPDVLSQFMLAVPMCLLYEAGLFLPASSAHGPSRSRNTRPSLEWGGGESGTRTPDKRIMIPLL